MKKVIISNFHLRKLIWIVFSKLYLIIPCSILLGAAASYLTADRNRSTYYAETAFFVYSQSNAQIIEIENGEATISRTDFRSSMRMVPTYMEAMRSESVMDKIAAYSEGRFTGPQLKSMVRYGSGSGTATIYAFMIAESPERAYEAACLLAEYMPEALREIVGRGQLTTFEYPIYSPRLYSLENNTKFTIIGFAGGFVLSVLAVLWFGLRNPVITKEAEITYISDEEIVGSVNRKKKLKKSEREPFFLENSMADEEKACYSGIRTRLLHFAKFTGKRKFAVIAEEGVSANSIAVNLAQSVAATGRTAEVFFGNSYDEPTEEIKKQAGKLYTLCAENNAAGNTAENAPENKAGNTSENTAENASENKAENSPDISLVTVSGREEDLKAFLTNADECLYLIVAKTKKSSMLRQQNILETLGEKRDSLCGYIFDKT